MKTGRPSKGSSLVDRIEGSGEAKRRAKAILAALREEVTVREACEQLGISEPRFYQLRDRFLALGITGLEPGLGGRPKKKAEEDAPVKALEARVARLELELKAARLREEIALVLPRLSRASEAPAKKGRKEKKR
jgi:transposase